MKTTHDEYILEFMSKKPASTKYIVDVPNYDSKGNDVSGDQPVGGGRRRKDGRLETSTHNYVPLDDYMDSIREDLKDEIRCEVRQEMEYEREFHYDYSYDEESAAERAEHIAESIITIMEGMAIIIQFINENPEMVEEFKKFGQSVKDGVSNSIKDATGRIKNAIAEKNIKQLAHSSLTTVNKKASVISKRINEIVALDRREANRQTVSIEEVRASFFRMLNAYISFRKEYDFLKSADIMDSVQVGLEDIFSKMECLVQSYPELLEDGSQERIRDLLSDFNDEQERRKLLEVFQMEE